MNQHRSVVHLSIAVPVVAHPSIVFSCTESVSHIVLFCLPSISFFILILCFEHSVGIWSRGLVGLFVEVVSKQNPTVQGEGSVNMRAGEAFFWMTSGHLLSLSSP